MEPYEEKAIREFAEVLMKTVEPYNYRGVNVYELPTPGLLPDWAMQYVKMHTHKLELGNLTFCVDRSGQIDTIFSHPATTNLTREEVFPSKDETVVFPDWSTANDETPE